MRDMHIYKDEQDIREKILASRTLSFAGKALSAEGKDWQDTLIKKEMANFIQKSLYEDSQAKITDADLFPLSTILVTSGWNKNDDVFSIEELFASRHTPEDKPFNFEHDDTDIIGHMVANSLVDVDHKRLPEDVVIEDLPDVVQILTHAVLYRRWSDADKLERMEDIIRDIAHGKWFVSMECLFSDFDYAIQTSSGAHKIVQRNSSTAFLTKHLRVYGGDGVHNGEKIGRLLKNIVFCGKGLVANPANPNSIIFANVRKFQPILSSDEQIVNSVIEKDFYQRGNVMPDKDNTVELLQEQNAEYKSEMQNLTLQLADMQKQMSKSNIDTLQKQIDDLSVTVTKGNEESDELKQKLDVANTEKTEMSTKLVDSEAKVDELNTKFDKLEAEATKKDRLSALEAVGKTSDEAKALYDKFGSLEKDMFNEIVKTITASDNTDSETDKEIDKAEANADTQILDKLESETNDADLSVTEDSEADEVKAKRLSLQKFVKAYCFHQDVSDDQDQEVN